MVLVNFDAIKHNAQLIKNEICCKKLCAVVKSDAYGHGLHCVANKICDVVDMFAVSNVTEALEVLHLGKKVLVLLPSSVVDTALAVANNCILSVDSLDTLQRVENCAKSLGKVALVHIKIDTGMNRFGFDNRNLSDLLSRLDTKHVSVGGVFSHFACADSDKAFTDRQFNTFCSLATMLENAFAKKLVKHIANTAATFLDSRYHLDMVRVGLGLYGYGDKRLMPAKTLLATIVATKEVPAGTTVGYGATFTCKKPTKIALLDVGYSNGFSKSFSNACVVQINGKSCCQIGNVCMGVMMVDATNCDASVGDVAVLFGNTTTWNKDVFMYETLCNTR